MKNCAVFTDTDGADAKNIQTACLGMTIDKWGLYLAVLSRWNKFQFNKPYKKIVEVLSCIMVVDILKRICFVSTLGPLVLQIRTALR
jgi:hypothetical protein